MLWDGCRLTSFVCLIVLLPGSYTLTLKGDRSSTALTASNVVFGDVFLWCVRACTRWCTTHILRLLFFFFGVSIVVCVSISYSPVCQMQRHLYRLMFLAADRSSLLGVWCSTGQSNMEKTVSYSWNGTAEMAAAQHPFIRLFQHPTVSCSPGQKPGPNNGIRAY